jgi:hypothetical protein
MSGDRKPGRQRKTPISLLLWLGFQCLLVAKVMAADELDLEEPSIWTHLVDVRTEFGYRDNPSYAATHPDASRFGALKLEYTLARLPVDSWQVLVLNSTDLTHYFDSQAADHEVFAFTLLQVQKETGPGISWEAGLQHVFQDQAIDASTTVLNTGSVYFHGNTVQLYGKWKQQWDTGWWLALKPSWELQFVEAPLDSSQQPGFQLAIGREHGKISSLSLSYSFRERLFDELTPTDALGVPQATGGLRFQQHEFELMYRCRLDAANRWRLTTRGGWLRNHDDGAGFYDYDKLFAGWDLRWRKKPWEVTLFGRAAYYDYPVQRIAGVGSEQREKALVSFGLQVRRELGQGWYTVLKAEQERSLSNLASDRYEANLLSLGVGWSN